LGVWIKIAAVVVAAALGLSVLVAWRDARKEQAALQAELKTTQAALEDATARQASRDSALTTLLSQLKQQKAAVQKPDQVIAALPGVLPLPQAITLDDGAAGTGVGGGGTDKARYKGKYPVTADFPAADLKPLYDFALDCKACQAQLSAAHGDLQDEQAKEKALSRERDDALRAAKGGSVLRRLARAAKWFAIGAAAGAIAAKVAR
jgi:type II secretory pathway pseudopilin PulG